ncbi:---NA--- [Octopus vulgaris]|uniref:---NA n=1 Tax=Octopus vulgaris TaxID=6645 RepID=A0AA36C0V7_OCTVU|nr:---NA--- [Octopus vulgaris]
MERFPSRQHVLIFCNRKRSKREGPHHSNICSKLASQSSNLTIHKRTDTGKKQYHHDICGKLFSESRKKPSHRNICGKSFSCNSHLTSHKRIHTGVPANSNLTSHKRIHLGKKPYHCNISSKSFGRCCE